MPFSSGNLRTLFAATDRLRQFKANQSNMTLDEFKACMVQLCDALKEAFKEGLRSALETAVSQASSYQQEARKVIDDIGSFLLYLKIQEKLLVNCGLGEATANDINACVAFLRPEIAKSSFDSSIVGKEIERLRDRTCSLSGEVSAFAEDLTSHYKLDRIVRRVYGTCLIGAAAAVGFSTAGIATPVSAAMVGAGTLLLTWDGWTEDPSVTKMGDFLQRKY